MFALWLRSFLLQLLDVFLVLDVLAFDGFDRFDLALAQELADDGLGDLPAQVYQVRVWPVSIFLHKWEY